MSIILSVIFILFISAVFILRKIKKVKFAKRFLKKWILWAKEMDKVPFWQHMVVVFSGLIFSSLCYLLFINLYKPHFTNPPTTAINWYTVHNYPMQQDKFYFVTSCAFIFIITCLFWFIWTKQKYKK